MIYIINNIYYSNLEQENTLIPNSLILKDLHTSIGGLSKSPT